jgi:DNA-binding HxlR family transcriptional regulator
MDVREGVGTVIACNLDQVFHILSGKWTLHVLWVLAIHGPTRFNELQRYLPGRISPKVLTQRLQRMEKDQLILRTEITIEKQTEVNYRLTNRGSALHQALTELQDLATRWSDAEIDAEIDAPNEAVNKPKSTSLDS